MATPDLAAHDPLAGAVADIGVEQARGHAVQTKDLDHPRQRLHEAPQRRQLFVRETARLFGGPARTVDGAAHEGQRQRDIIRDALGAQFIDDREARAPGIVDACPNLQTLLEYDRSAGWCENPAIARYNEIDRAKLDLGARLPDKIAAVNLRMQSADEYADTPERQASLQPSVRSTRP